MQLAGCQRKAADPAPPADPLNVQGALQLHSGYEEEKAQLLGKVNQLREIAHLYNDVAEDCTYASEPQLRVQDFCSSLSEL